MLGSLMFASRVTMAALPNIHLLGMFIMTFTVVFRIRALIPLYIYIFLEGLFSGFALWWMPYLYVWTVLWGLTMLIPKRTPRKVKYFLYPAICALHGYCFGILYTPAQALIMGWSFEQALVWAAGGTLFDIAHGTSNIFAGMLVLPLSELLNRLVYKKAL